MSGCTSHRFETTVLRAVAIHRRRKINDMVDRWCWLWTRRAVAKPNLACGTETDLLENPRRRGVIDEMAGVDAPVPQSTAEQQDTAHRFSCIAPAPVTLRDPVSKFGLTPLIDEADAADQARAVGPGKRYEEVRVPAALRGDCE